MDSLDRNERTKEAKILAWRLLMVNTHFTVPSTGETIFKMTRSGSCDPNATERKNRSLALLFESVK